MRRLLIVVIGLAFAVVAGVVFLFVAGLAAPATRELASDATLGSLFALIASLASPDGPNPAVAVALGGFAALVAALLTLPPLITALVGEVAGLRSFTWYSGGSAILAAAIAWLGHPAGVAPDAADSKVLLLLFLTGAVAGLVYWAIAGRHAGGGAQAPAVADRF